MSRKRLNIFLEPAHAKQLDQLAAMRGLSKSSIIAAALASVLSPDSADRREAALAQRLDRLTRQFSKLERDQNVLIETLALFIRYYLSVTASVPESQHEAVRAQGRARFEQFIQQLARHLQRGHSLVRDLHEEIFPSESEFFGETPHPAATNGSGADA